MSSRSVRALTLCAGFAALVPHFGCTSSGEPSPTRTSGSALDTGLTVVSNVSLSASSAGVGQTVTATITYANQTSAPLAIDTVVLAARPPGGTHAGGPYDDFQPAAPPTTVAAGASITVSASRTFTAGDPTGVWDVYPTYRDDQGTWHDGPDVSLSVGQTPGAFGISSDLALSAASATAGQTITGQVTYTNATSSPVVLKAVVIAARPPGGTHGAGPYDDFAPSTQATTVAPGASITVSASRTFAAGDPAGAWDVYPTYEDDTGAWHDGPDQALQLGSTPATGNFSVQGGKIIAPDGSVFVARGINVYDSQQGEVSTNAAGQPLTSVFPGINFVRLATFQYSDPSYFQTFVQQMSALKIVVEIEHHSGAGGGVPPLTGQALTDESNWFAALAQAFRGNPYVWFGTLNEPSGPGGDLTAEQSSNYDAIRGAGSESMIMMEVLGDYATGTYVVGNGHGLIASSYAAMRNIVWDFHYYNWLSGYSADLGTNADLLASFIGQSQTITSGDGTVPVLIGEYGISTDGQNVDVGGTQTCIAVQQSGVGSSAWHWNSYAASDNLTDGNGNLTAYGAQVATYINAAH